MSSQLPSNFCDGPGDPFEEDRERVLLTNPVTRRGSVHSTDQTDKNRPEWIFPRCPMNMTYMMGCKSIIDKHENENELPADL